MRRTRMLTVMLLMGAGAFAVGGCNYGDVELTSQDRLGAARTVFDSTLDSLIVLRKSQAFSAEEWQAVKLSVLVTQRTLDTWQASLVLEQSPDPHEKAAGEALLELKATDIGAKSALRKRGDL